mgnify:CR=1 FL=1
MEKQNVVRLDFGFGLEPTKTTIPNQSFNSNIMGSVLCWVQCPLTFFDYGCSFWPVPGSPFQSFVKSNFSVCKNFWSRKAGSCHYLSQFVDLMIPHFNCSIFVDQTNQMSFFDFPSGIFRSQYVVNLFVMKNRFRGRFPVFRINDRSEGLIVIVYHASIFILSLFVVLSVKEYNVVSWTIWSCGSGFLSTKFKTKNWFQVSLRIFPNWTSILISHGFHLTFTSRFTSLFFKPNTTGFFIFVTLTYVPGLIG